MKKKYPLILTTAMAACGFITAAFATVSDSTLEEWQAQQQVLRCTPYPECVLLADPQSRTPAEQEQDEK